MIAPRPAVALVVAGLVATAAAASGIWVVRAGETDPSAAIAPLPAAGAGPAESARLRAFDRPATRTSLLEPPEPAPLPAPPPLRRRSRLEPDSLTIAALVEELRDDDVRWNATGAARELLLRMEDPEQYATVHLELESALSSDDFQQARIATGLLHTISETPPPRGLDRYRPSETLLDRTADALEDWDADFDSSFIPGDLDDEKSVRFAVAHIERIEQRLVHKLVALPEEERFIHAYILARAKRTHLTNLTAPVLVTSLRDNDVRRDALMSMEALQHLGDAALPWLHPFPSDADEQQRSCLELLLRERAGPARTRAERAERKALNQVTRTCENPLTGWRYSGLEGR